MKVEGQIEVNLGASNMPRYSVIWVYCTFVVDGRMTRTNTEMNIST